MSVYHEAAHVILHANGMSYNRSLSQFHKVIGMYSFFVSEARPVKNELFVSFVQNSQDL
jgi:hypothetical protein